LDLLTFVSTIIKSIAWPIVVVVVFLVLKRQIANLLGDLGNRILTAKGAGFELTFGQRVDQIEEISPGYGSQGNCRFPGRRADLWVGPIASTLHCLSGVVET